jgi:hypothetical protein
VAGGAGLSGAGVATTGVATTTAAGTLSGTATASAGTGRPGAATAVGTDVSAVGRIQIQPPSAITVSAARAIAA